MDRTGQDADGAAVLANHGQHSDVMADHSRPNEANGACEAPCELGCARDATAAEATEPAEPSSQHVSGRSWACLHPCTNETLALLHMDC